MKPAIEDFKAALRNFPSGVTIVTSIDECRRPVGATISAFTSVSADPPMVLVCLNGLTRSALAIRHSQAFSVHLLSSGQVELAKRFAYDQGEKFPDESFEEGATGAPALPECDVRLDCKVVSETSGGTHGIFVGQVQEIVTSEIDPLIYANRTFYAARTLQIVASS